MRAGNDGLRRVVPGADGGEIVPLLDKRVSIYLATIGRLQQLACSNRLLLSVKKTSNA